MLADSLVILIIWVKTRQKWRDVMYTREDSSVSLPLYLLRNGEYALPARFYCTNIFIDISPGLMYLLYVMQLAAHIVVVSARVYFTSVTSGLFAVNRCSAGYFCTCESVHNRVSGKQSTFP